MSLKAHEDRLAELKQLDNPTKEQAEEMRLIEDYLKSQNEAPKAEAPKAASKPAKNPKK